MNSNEFAYRFVYCKLNEMKSGNILQLILYISINYILTGGEIMIVNGKEEQYQDITIIQLLEHYNLDKDSVVVEINRNIVPKKEYETYILDSLDKVEIVRFVGGG